MSYEYKELKEFKVIISDLFFIELDPKSIFL